MWPLGSNSTQVIGPHGVDCWANTTKEMSQLLSRNQLEQNKRRVGETGAGAGVGAGVLGAGWGDMSTTLCPVVGVREQEGLVERFFDLGNSCQIGDLDAFYRFVWVIDYGAMLVRKHRSPRSAVRGR